MSDELENPLESWEELAREAVAEFEDARGYASSYFTDKWGYDKTSRRFAETIKRLASLRARPQEPGLSKKKLQQIFSECRFQFHIDRPAAMMACGTHYEELVIDAILSAPSGPLSAPKVILMDVDGCVNRDDGSIRPGILTFADTIALLGGEIVLWSAGGRDHARDEAQRAGIHGSVLRYFDKFDYLEGTAEQVIELIGSRPILQIDDDPTERIGDWNFWLWDRSSRGPLSDEPRGKENQDVAAPVLGGDE